MNLKLINYTLIFFTAIALFFILTSGIPLMEWGVVEHWGLSKKRYVKATRYAFLVLVGIWGVAYLLFRREFKSLGIVKALLAFKSLPFRVNLGILFSLYVAVLSAVSFIRHQALETRGFDLGIFSQAVWNTTQGDFLFSSIKNNICLLGDHVSLILAAAAPFYALWSDPRMLLFLQVLAAASCVFIIALIAKDKLQSHGSAFLFGVTYLTYFPTRAVLHEDFHPETLVEPFMLLAFWFLEKGRIKAFLLCLLVLITGKENMLGISFILGFYACFFKRMRLLGATIMLASVALFFWEVSWLVPKISGEPYLYRGSYDEFWSPEGTGILNRIFSGDSFEYLFKVFGPFLFFPFFHLPTLILTAPIFFQNILSENDVMRSFNYHYTIGLTPFVFIASIYGYQTLLNRVPVLKLFRVFLLLGLFSVSFIKSGPAEYYYFWQSAQKIDPYMTVIREKMRELPSEYSVLTHNNFIPQMVNRKYIYQFDYTTTFTKLEYAKKHDIDYVVMDEAFWEPNTQPLPEVLEDLQGAGYKIEYQHNAFYMLKKVKNES